MVVGWRQTGSDAEQSLEGGHRSPPIWFGQLTNPAIRRDSFAGVGEYSLDDRPDGALPAQSGTPTVRLESLDGAAVIRFIGQECPNRGFGSACVDGNRKTPRRASIRSVYGGGN